MESYLANNLPKAAHDGQQQQHQKQEIAQHLADRKDRDETKEVFVLAGQSALMTAPVVTAAGIAMMFSPYSRSGHMDFTLCIRMLGVPVAIGGIVVDAVKLPVLATFSLGAALYGVGRWLKSLVVRPSDTETQKKEIMQSVARRFANTCQLLVSMQMETAHTILDKIQQFQDVDLKEEKKNSDKKNGMAMLCGFTALNTAFASRRLDATCILLANGKVLFRNKCPSQGRPFFDAILRVRALLTRAGLDNKTNAQATPLMLEWLPLLKALLELQFADKETIESDNRIPVDSNQRALILGLVREMHKAGLCAIGTSQLKKNEYAMSIAARETVHGVPHLAPPPVRDQIEGVIRFDADTPVGSSSSSSSLCPAPERKVFVDSHDRTKITSFPVVGEDGMIYDSARAASRKVVGQILYACRDEASSGNACYADHDDLRVDPITCNELVTPVVANDGFLYDASTFELLKQQQFVGRGGVVLVSCVPCRHNLWPTLSVSNK